MEAVSIRAVADAVGVTPPSIYLHFADKDELFFEVCRRRFADFGLALMEALEGLDDPVDELRALGRAYIRYGLDNPEHYRILFGQKVAMPDSADGPEDLPGLQAFQLLVDTVGRGVDAGVFADRDPVEMAIGLWATTHGFVTLAHFEEEMPDLMPIMASLDRVLEQALRGVLA